MWPIVLFAPAALLLGAACARRVLTYRRMAAPPVRTPRPPGRPLTAYEAAYLRDGREAVAETAMAVLHLAGRLPVVDEYRLAATGPQPHEDVQAAVLIAKGGGESRDARVIRLGVAASPAVHRVAARLVAQGLATDVALAGRVGRTETDEVAAAVLAGCAGAGAVVWSVQAGDGPARPAVAFALLLGCWAVARAKRPRRFALGHGTREGRALYRATREDDSWEPRPAWSVQLPSGNRADVAAVSLQGLDGSGRLPELTHALAGPPPPVRTATAGTATTPHVSDPPGLGGVGCGGGCGGCGGCGGGL
ncbi:TIGR04222 domain-containing membrane protein [Streptomyces sp. NPDC048507]|uniref:TIGR04222 domain-containing membrane protein n=1 Tax=Streptomyces sp. NPDC048507 TaxID=3365560 RepID=UPI00371D733B